MKIKHSKLKKIGLFDTILIIFFFILGIVTIYPFYNVFVLSGANTVSVAKHTPYLLPYVWDWTGYKTIFKDVSFFRSLMVSIFTTVVGTSINMILSVTGAYVLSRKELLGRKFFLGMILFTMLFSGGLVPTYLVNKGLGLINNIWVLVLPTAISTYYLIIMKNYFISLPSSLIEAAKIDGAHELTILIKVIIPISMPFMATFALFYAVERWNEWYNAMLYINKTSLQPMQIYLREVLVSMNSQLAAQAQQMIGATHKVYTTSIQMATIVITTVPILCVYPFVQKHFVKGIMIGGIKE